MNIRVLAITLVLAALFGTAAFFGGRAILHGGESTPQRLGKTTLEGVGLNTLAGAYIYVSPPPEGYAPKVSSDTAKLAVASEYPSVSARQALLAHLETPDAGGIDGQVWIVNLDPTPRLANGSLMNT